MTDSEKAVLNTTISKDVLDGFRAYCKATNCPMNVILESFMRQFAAGEFIIKLGKNNCKVDLED